MRESTFQKTPLKTLGLTSKIKRSQTSSSSGYRTGTKPTRQQSEQMGLVSYSCRGTGFQLIFSKMDGSGRKSKQNRQFLRPIIPFQNQDNYNVHKQLPLQQFTNELNLDAMDNTSHSNTGPTAVSREASTPGKPADRSYQIQVQEPDTLPQSEPMSDQDFDDGLTKAVRSVRTNTQQNKGTGPGRALPCPRDLSPPVSPTNTRNKRVRISTKRYIAEY